jgi:hypothetical protein
MAIGWGNSGAWATNGLRGVPAGVNSKRVANAEKCNPGRPGIASGTAAIPPATRMIVSAVGKGKDLIG